MLFGSAALKLRYFLLTIAGFIYPSGFLFSISNAALPRLKRPIQLPLCSTHSLQFPCSDQNGTKNIAALARTNRTEGGDRDMSYASFTNSPVSTKFSVRSVAVGREVTASLGKRRLTILLIAAAATEFLLVAGAAYLAAALYQRLILLYWPESAKYIPEALLISTLNCFFPSDIGNTHKSGRSPVVPSYGTASAACSSFSSSSSR